jgi:hypothetical protein
VVYRGAWNLLFIDSIFEVLRDGGWHSIQKVLKYSVNSEVKTLMAIRFLCRFGFITINKNEDQMRLTSPMFNFMSEIEAE